MKTTITNTSKDIVDKIANKLLMDKNSAGEQKNFKREISFGYEIYRKELNMEVFMKEGKFEYDDLVLLKYVDKNGKKSFVLDDSVVLKS